VIQKALVLPNYLTASNGGFQTALAKNKKARPGNARPGLIQKD